MEGILEVAIALARRAGSIHLDRLASEHEVAYKGDVDLVTEVDRLAERSILEGLRKEFPSHQIVAEESGIIGLEGEYCWYVDPLDGTTNYLHGFPFFGVSLGLAIRGQVTVGVVYAAALGEL
ncbi:MAG: inositol monophosphatase, partial [Cyanobacteria bacterium REEB65]|nr:inositol monophosphatase [Cyanobacteria bacterium REEB65]